LKIDRSFLTGLPEDPEHTAITRAIIAMAKSLNLRVIAEGVDDGEQLEFLREKGCDEVQGNLLSFAIPSEDFVRLARDGKPLR
jgi:EAL domain-containing protein (putative c-di-GMP-specific phosphodiesterase class I)